MDSSTLSTDAMAADESVMELARKTATLRISSLGAISEDSIAFVLAMGSWCPVFDGQITDIPYYGDFTR